ncbi:YggS family pyridoxal phosphate-dependent enzyme [Stackebrandtia soli]|uniref:YggS family pyridoxal phosphate-dependent enzyme n=1 Tax=Stackebrandtia soli TaxID=1892856 RepID=UPI0039EA6943
MDDENSDRLVDLSNRLTQARTEIERACVAARREPKSVRLIAVTKHFPASDVRLLARLGVADVGENRDQEAAAKAAELAADSPPVDVRWHFIGRLQRNKCRSVARYADWVHSIDRASLIAPLDRARVEVGRPLPVLIQVSVDGDSARGGATAAELVPLAEAVLASETLRLRGIMGVAPLDWKPADAYAELARHAATIATMEPSATELSAGMSGDFAEAIAQGATFIRLGSKLLGPRTEVGYPGGK